MDNGVAIQFCKYKPFIVEFSAEIIILVALISNCLSCYKTFFGCFINSYAFMIIQMVDQADH